MSRLEDALRPYWARGLSSVTVGKYEAIADGIGAGKDYQIYHQVEKEKFVLSVVDRANFLPSMARDCNRFSTSALETVIKGEDTNTLPKNLSWVLIKQYYSAFYSAHLLLRILGSSLTQIDAQTIDKVKRVADAYGYRNGIDIESGYYLIDYSTNSNEINFSKINIKGDGGSHIALWKMFGSKVKEISLDILARNPNTSFQACSLKFDELVKNLEYVGSNNYSWLSRMRNDLNYRHIHGVWHPYSLTTTKVEKLKRMSNDWKSDLLQMNLQNHVGDELQRFSATCHFIIGMGHVICNDMMHRCSFGKSFLTNGYGRVLSLA